MQREQPLKHNLIFLFNGAEENMLPVSKFLFFLITYLLKKIKNLLNHQDYVIKSFVSLLSFYFKYLSQFVIHLELKFKIEANTKVNFVFWLAFGSNNDDRLQVILSIAKLSHNTCKLTCIYQC